MVNNPVEKFTPITYEESTNNQHSSQSATIGKLAAALAKSQSEMAGAVKSADNPFFKSRYADV